MSNIVQAQSQVPAAVQAKSEVEFVAFGSEDKIKLNLAVIRNYVATPTREGDLPDERNCMRFMMLCRSRRLNPFDGDAFMIGFRKGNFDPPVIEWSLITSQSAFMKRAELHPEFDGFESGVIVKDAEDRIIEREGDLLWNGDELIGGWCNVHFKTRKFPCRKKVQLSTYRKNFGVWVTDPAGMICKVAEVHALRDAFPTSLGGLLLREEMQAVDIEAQVIATQESKRPEFSRGLPSTEMKEAPATHSVRKGEKPAPGTLKRAQDEKPPVSTPPGQQTPQASPAASATPANSASAGSPDDGQTGSEPTEEELEAAAGATTSRNETQTSAAAAGPTGAPTTTPTPAPVAAASPSGPKNDPATFKPKEGESIPLTSVRRWLHTEAKSETELMAVLVANKAAKPGQKLNELSEPKIDNVYKARATLLTQMNQQPAK